MSATQMNIRMDSTLKEAGNAAIARLGLSPSQVTRLLWEYVAVHDALPPGMTRATNGDMLANGGNTTRRSSHEALEGSNLVASFYHRVGIDEPQTQDASYDQLREIAAAEQLEKWGLA